MEFKGTKGEFIIKDRDKNGVFVTNDTGSFAVARVFRGSNLTLEEFEANAKLIAASPDLLELCLLVYNSFGGGNVITFSEKDINDFKQAIEKALK